ncbi:MAG: RIP metalloprotease RseP [Hyphomicrobiales bacterium]|nr:RIP metalloprotease RseP [Hyphomicrobiales bacterium]MCY4052275.1 RIP metalloprotease RseP [Hyphomicrobiales bacterium]
MEMLAGFFGFLSSSAGYILPFLFVLTVVVFFHELGHFAVARWNGVRVETFSVGFGSEIFGYTDKHGTRWKFSWIPLGGYVRFHGDANVASTPDNSSLDEDDEGNFHTKSVGARMAVAAAGPIANFILAIVIFATLAFFFGEYSRPPRIDEVRPDSAAEQAGLLAGDIVRAIDGVEIESFQDIREEVLRHPDESLEFTIDRGGDFLILAVTPRWETVTDLFGNETRAGVLGVLQHAGTQDEEIRHVEYGIIGAIGQGISRTYAITRDTLGYIGQMITGQRNADQLGGPIRIAQISGQTAEIGWLALIQLTALLSVSIGLINLFPIPLLDGGHLLYYSIEGLLGRPLAQRYQNAGFHLGLAFVILLMVFVTWNDLRHLKLFTYLRDVLS